MPISNEDLAAKRRRQGPVLPIRRRGLAKGGPVKKGKK
jgi:hypothetical protein